MSEYVTIEKTKFPYMLPILISYGYVHIYCDKYEIDNEYIYAYVKDQIVLGMHMLDVKELKFIWVC